MNLEELPAENLEKFFQGSRTAGHRNEGVGLINHGDLTLMHSIDNVEGCLPGVHALPLHELVGDHAVDFAARIQGRARDGSHQTGAAASINYSHATFCTQGSQLTGAGGESGVIAHSSAAIHGKVKTISHVLLLSSDAFIHATVRGTRAST